MLKSKCFVCKFVPFILSIVIVFSTSVISVPAQVVDEIIFENEDSTFVLKNVNIHSGIDDYYPETADINDEDVYNRQSMQTNEISTFAATETVGDPMVYLTQKWLNQEYGDVEGFGSVTENGKTGWNVVYGLTRALQHELGITSLANNFGPTTASLYGQNPLQRQDGVTDRKFAILQGALWCKGYNPGYYLTQDSETGIVSFKEVFNESVENAVISLKKDAGLLNPDGVVTVNVMKALLSMDAFKLLGSYYGGRSEVRAIQQQLNRTYEAYTGLNPCDGVYGRNTNRALIYAFQAEEGLPVSVSSGTFGPTTRTLAPQIPYEIGSGAAKNYQGNYYSSGSITAFTKLLQYALLIHGFGDSTFDGVFSSSTQKAVRAFQRHYALPVTGVVNLDTWMALLVSSGNPNRPAIAADCATILNEAKAQTLYNNGYRYIGRYLTGTYGGGISKALTVEEANIILDAGLRFFPIYQTSANKESYFTTAQGTYDGQAAITAARALGVPNDTIIYFAVDFDAMDYQITNSVIPYFENVYAEVKTSGYKVGIYGARNVCTRVSKAGYACSSFVGDMSTGFSGNLGFKIPDNWAFSQFANLEGDNALGTGDGKIEIDKDAFSGRDQGVGKLNKVVKKAIYVLPGYMGSKLFSEDDTQYWIEGTGMNISLVNGDNLPLVGDIASNAINRKSSALMLNSDGSGSKMHVDATRDAYGATNTYQALVEKLTKEFDGEYTVEFFPYNWLGDLNDSEKLLRRDIKIKGYTNIVFVTHSTGGLLASAFIAKNQQSADKVKIDKAILVAAPLFGTYSALAPLETGSGALIGSSYELVNGFAQAAKFAEVNPHFSPDLRLKLGAVTLIYDAANNWIKDVTHNSPTTYQLLPSVEYLKLMPQLYENEFKRGTAVTTASRYYSILNGSANINSNLTNGNNRSHRYFRETVLGGDIVSILQTVDTILIASDSADKKTPIIAVYANKIFGGTKLKELIYRGKDDYAQVGDGTVAYCSATANDGSGEKLPVYTFSRIGHTELISYYLVLQQICDEINGIISDGTADLFSVSSLDDSIGMSDLIKVNYTADVLVEAKVYDSDNTEIAKVSPDDFFGFDGESLIYCSYAEQGQANSSDATIYFPAEGCRLVFQYGNSADVDINFQAEVSTLHDDGLKDVSVTSTISKTTADGIILSLDGTNAPLDNTNLAAIVGGTSQNHLTEWELPSELELLLGQTKTISVAGEDADLVFSSLEWSSSDEQVITVSSSGVVTAIGYGKATVTATDGNKTSSCTVTVPQNATSVSFSDLSLTVGERTPLEPIFYPATSTETELTYTYDTASIVCIDEYNVLHALAAGTVTITATTDYGITTSFIVTVTDPDFIIKPGDITDDGFTDIRDLVRLKKYLAGMITLSGRAFAAANLQPDQEINTQDMVRLRQLLLGIE